MNYDRIFILFTFVLIFLLSPIQVQAEAQGDGTPDGYTPANEDVCNDLIGGTPGLYGLCVAYCEAQDLDEFNKEPPSIHILENYRKKMVEGDPDMPCVKSPCDCWSPEELNAFTSFPEPVQCDLYPEDYLRIADAERMAMVGYDESVCRYRDSAMEREMNVDRETADICAAQIIDKCGEFGIFP